MAAITTFHEISVEDIKSCSISGGTATPTRKAKLYIKADSAGATDTIDLNAVVDVDINDIEGLVYSTVGGEPSAGTAGVDWAGTSITTTGGAGTHEICVVVNYK